MSGIAGLYRLDSRPVESATVQAMTGAMPHRNLDGHAAWIEGAIGLSQGLVFTTPESQHEVLPCTSPRGNTIVADARIDNRDELCRLLGREDRGMVPDGELILDAYDAWGEDCVDHLVGDFAFAVWDATERKLFCARDHFGMRPLYYYHEPGRFLAFGTEIKAILALPDVPRRLDEVCVGNYLANLRDAVEHTIYEGVHRLLNAHALVADAHGVRTRCYYELRPAQGLPACTDEEYAERFRELFDEAVRCRVRSAYPVAAQLSGGLDSSAIACVARDILEDEGRGPLHTLSVLFEETTASDEREFIEAVLAQGGMNPHYVQGDEASPLSNLDELYGFFDEALVGGTQHLAWTLTKKAGELGVRIVLDGLDGDSTVDHGELYLRELARRGDWETFRQEGTQLAERYRTAQHRQAFQEMSSSFASLFSGFGIPELQARAERGSWFAFFKQMNAAYEHIPFDRWMYFKSVWKKMLVPASVLETRHARKARQREPLLPFVDPEFAARTGLYDRYRQHHVEVPQTTVREAQRVVLASRRRITSLETSNHVSAAFGIEAAHPFYDKRLVEYCLALPPEQSLRDGWPRLILRRALAETMPDLVTWRAGKAVMAPNFLSGLFERDASRLEAELTDLGPLEAYVNKEEVERALSGSTTESERQLVQLAGVATLSYWLKQRFGGGESARAPAYKEQRPSPVPRDASGA